MNASGQLMMVESEPYSWPFDNDFRIENTVLLVVDCQTEPLSDPVLSQLIPAAKEVIRVARSSELRCMYTQFVSNSGSQGKGFLPTSPAGSVGWKIVEALAPYPYEIVIQKTRLNAFLGTDLDFRLQQSNVKNLVLVGQSTDGSIHATMRDANDRGYECLLLADACAARSPANHESILTITRTCHGLFGTVGNSAAFLRALEGK